MDGQQKGPKSLVKFLVVGTREKALSQPSIKKKIIAPFCYKGTCDNILFNFWLENFLLPAIGSGYILIMDNAAFHKSEKT